MAPRPTPRWRATLGDIANGAGAAVRARVDSVLVGPRMRAAVEVARRLDGVAAIVNTLTGMGGARDKSTASMVDPARRTSMLTGPQLDTLYRFDGYARRYVDRLIDGMLSEGWHLVDNDTRIDLVDDEERRLRVVDRVREALEIAFARGGALVVVMTEDPGASYATPLEPDDIVEIRALLVLDPDEFSPRSWETDPESDQYRLPRTYFLSPTTPGGYSALSGLEVHWSRCLYFPGRRVLPRIRQERNGIDDPIFEAVLPELFNLRAVDNAAGVMAAELKQDVMRSPGLGALEAGALWQATEARIRALSASRSAVNMVLLGDDETFETRQTNATGYRELRDGAKSAWSAVTGMPQTIAFGDAPSGLRGGRDEAGERAWASICQAWQESHLRRELERLYTMIIAQDAVGGDVPESWQLVFEPLIKLTELEEAQVRQTTAATDAIGIDAGWLDANEVRAGRFGPAGWRMDLPPLEGELDPVPPPMPPPVVVPAGGVPAEGELEEPDDEDDSAAES